MVEGVLVIPEDKDHVTPYIHIIKGGFLLAKHVVLVFEAGLDSSGAACDRRSGRLDNLPR